MSGFTGLAGTAMPWDFQYFLKLELSYFQGYIRSFFDQMDFVNETWIQGRSEGVAWQNEDVRASTLSALG
jgi:hypothetical protein